MITYFILDVNEMLTCEKVITEMSKFIRRVKEVENSVKKQETLIWGPPALVGVRGFEPPTSPVVGVAANLRLEP